MIISDIRKFCELFFHKTGKIPLTGGREWDNYLILDLSYFVDTDFKAD